MNGVNTDPTPEQMEEAVVNAKMYNYVQQTYQPFIKEFIANKTQDAGTDVQAKKIAGQVNAEVMKGMTSAGLKPGQTNAVTETKVGDTAAGIDVAANQDAQGKLKTRQLNNLNSIVSIGRGQQTTAQQGMEGLAASSVSKQLTGNEITMQRDARTANAVGSAVGTAAAVGGAVARQPSTYDPTSNLTSTGVMASDANIPAFNPDPNLFVPQSQITIPMGGP